MKYTQEVEIIKRALEIPHNTYDLLLDSVVEKMLLKYEKALDKAIDMYFRNKNSFFMSKEGLKRYLFEESEKQEIKKCKWCGSEIKENHKGYCSELCREYGEEWEHEKQLAIESEKQ